MIEGKGMAQIDDGRKQFESAFMSDYWTFRKKFATPETSEEYWNAITNEADMLYEKYYRDEYVKQIILACVDDLECRAFPVGWNGKRRNAVESTFSRLMRKREG